MFSYTYCLLFGWQVVNVNVNVMLRDLLQSSRDTSFFWNLAFKNHVMSLTFWDTIGFNPLGVFYCKLQVLKRHICAMNISNFRLMRNLLVFISSIHKRIRVEVFGNNKSDSYIWQEMIGLMNSKLFWFSLPWNDKALHRSGLVLISCWSISLPSHAEWAVGLRN